MYIWAKIPDSYRAMGSVEFAKHLLAKARSVSHPASALATMATTMCAFALIENEARIRQAVRGIKAMFKADNLAHAAPAA